MRRPPTPRSGDRRVVTTDAVGVDRERAWPGSYAGSTPTTLPSHPGPEDHLTDAVRWGEGTTRPPAIIATHPAGHDAAIARLVAAGWQITAEQPAGTHLAKPLNHVLHFFIGLFTLGLWWWVWLILAIMPRRHFVPRTVN